MTVQKTLFIILVPFLFIISVAFGYLIRTQISSTPSITSIPSTNMTEISVPIVTPKVQLPVIRSLEQLRFQDSIVTHTDDTVTLMVTGDVLLARSVNSKMVQRNDMNWPFLQTADRLKSADITFINLETPLVTDCPVRNDGMIFCGDPRTVEGLQFAGVDVVNLANNHMGNWRQDGVNETMHILEQAQIRHTGVNAFTISEVQGTTFAFLGFNEVGVQTGIPLLTESLVAQQLAVAREQADVVIVQFHWGQEYTYQPTSSQKHWAKFAIDEGADVVIGNHPHWWQPIEFYKEKPIVYSHGNFIFDQMWSKETRIGLVGEYFFQNKRLIDIKFHPVLIEDYGQPRWLEGTEKQQVLEAFIKESFKIKNVED